MGIEAADDEEKLSILVLSNQTLSLLGKALSFSKSGISSMPVVPVESTVGVWVKVRGFGVVKENK